MDNLQPHGHARFHRARRTSTEEAYDIVPRELVPEAPTRPLLEPAKALLVPRSSCTNDTDDGCHKATQTPTLPIVLGVVIPLVGAIIVLIYLHRRHVKKLRMEDANDPHKSLDFGVDPAVAGGKNRRKGAPDMVMTEKPGRARGMSIDMDMKSPYILPGNLRGSRESLHSLSRSMHDPDDPYRPVTESIRGGSSLNRYPTRDNASMMTTSSGTPSRKGMNDGLLQNAQRMSKSFPLRGASMSPTERTMPEIKFPDPVAAPRSFSPLGSPERALSPPALRPGNHGVSPPVPPMPQNNLVAGGPLPPNPPPAPAPPALNEPSQSSDLPNLHDTRAAGQASPSPPPLPRVASQAAVMESDTKTTSFMSDSSYAGGFKVTPPSPQASETEFPEKKVLSPQPRKPETKAPVGLGVDDLGYDPRRLSMSVRPLPSEDPNENPEERANRIRSFYKEYFDESKPEPAGGYTANYEDYGDGEHLDGTIFDPYTGNFIVAQPSAPFAQPVTRRAMTPPPRAPPRQFGGPRPGHFSGSAASSPRGPPRGMSSMSGRLPAPKPKKALPPPSPLSSLPTPHKLKEDAMIFDAMDFAPPVSYRDRQLGRRPDSPLGTPRPFSPAVRPHTPLASSFDDLAAMPSPHLLRKSGTFTALDFAPPPRFRDTGSGMSDAGSIRSNRSGMSQAGRMAIRNGAYRVSKIPKEVVGTKEDIVSSLRPTLNMVAPA
ncbi:hypothetical protein GQ43DRAFT_414597 [Delitschia confertaspora ATCC 74209]|uniref:Uncharacterized protein n=1 Tax=Delitschia confertaspora ATCC 74209 TaxID=1513339 RepID=A0A9P4JSX4_9PLEO|nr:hypothetical protein GQ43DRAFT_414597 [Delitschia confertaspora ATCC 74209]